MRIGIYAHGGLGNWVMASPMLRALEILGHAVHLLVRDFEDRETQLIEQVSWLPLRDVESFQPEDLQAEYDVGFSFRHPGDFPAQDRYLFHQMPQWKEYELVRWRFTGMAEVDYFMQAARFLGWRGPPPAPFVPQCHDLDLRPHLGIALGSKAGPDWYKKMWSWYSWLSVIAIISENYLPCVIYGGGELDVLQAKRIQEHAPQCGVYMDRPLTSLASVLRRSCRLLVGNDTGLLHIAAAVGVPVLGLFGPTLPLKNTPAGPADTRILTAPAPCVPCYGGRLWNMCDGGCMQQIGPNTVIDHIKHMLALN